MNLSFKGLLSLPPKRDNKAGFTLITILAAALLVSGVFVVYAQDEVSIVSADPAVVSDDFIPALNNGDGIARGNTQYLGRTTTYIGSPLGTAGDTIKWKVAIAGPSALTADMVDLDEVGFDDTDGAGIVVGTYHYPFAVSGGNLVATGSCDVSEEDLTPPNHSNTCDALIGFSLDANDVFTNADKITFNSSAPLGAYTIIYELVDTQGTSDTSDDVVLSNAYAVNVDVVGEVTLTRPSPEDLTIESTFSPALGSTLARDTDAYYGIRSVSSLAATIPGVHWTITIEGPAGFTPSMVDVDEVGWKDIGPNPDSSTVFHYPFAGSGTLVATGSCTDPDPEHSNTCPTDTFDVDPDDDFTNVDRITFNTSAPPGTYTIKRQLVYEDGSGPVSNEITVATIQLTESLTTLEVGLGKPYTSIQSAIGDATAGDTIQVAAGTYAEPIQQLPACGNEPASLCIDKSLTLRGDPGDASAGPGSNAPVLDGSALANGSAIALRRDGSPISDVAIVGFIVRNYENPGSSGGVGSGVIAWNTDASDITVQDNS